MTVDVGEAGNRPSLERRRSRRGRDAFGHRLDPPGFDLDQDVLRGVAQPRPLGMPQPGPVQTDPLEVTAHRDADAALSRYVDRAVVARISVPHDAGAGVVRQDAFQLSSCVIRSVVDDPRSLVDGPADADPAAVMDSDP